MIHRTYLVKLNFLDEDYTNEEDTANTAGSKKKTDKTTKKLQEELIETEVNKKILIVKFI